jgi:hypothetical protein
MALIPAKEFLNDAEHRGFAAKHATICGICDNPLTATDKQDPQGPQYIKKGGQSVQVHVDCYFDQQGKDLEPYPIASPRVRRRV